VSPLAEWCEHVRGSQTPRLAWDWAEWIERPLPENFSVSGLLGPAPAPFWVWCPNGDPEGGDVLLWSDREPAVCLWDHPMGRMVLARGPGGMAWPQFFQPTTTYLGALRPLAYPVTHAERDPAWT